MRKQRGVTMIGWIFLLTPMAIVLYAGMRVIPEYLNYYKVVSALKETATQLKTEEALSPERIRSSLGGRFNVGYVDEPNIKDIAVSRDEGGNWAMTADYEKAVPMFGNLQLLLLFKTTVVIN